MIEYGCLNCGEVMTSPVSMAGQKETCPECGALSTVVRRRISIPAPAPAVEPAAEQIDHDSLVEHIAQDSLPEWHAESLSLLQDIRSDVRWITVRLKIVVYTAAAVVLGAVALYLYMSLEYRVS